MRFVKAALIVDPVVLMARLQTREGGAPSQLYGAGWVTWLRRAFWHHFTRVQWKDRRVFDWYNGRGVVIECWDAKDAVELARLLYARHNVRDRSHNPEWHLLMGEGSFAVRVGWRGRRRSVVVLPPGELKRDTEGILLDLGAIRGPSMELMNEAESEARTRKPLSREQRYRRSLQRAKQKRAGKRARREKQKLWRMDLRMGREPIGRPMRVRSYRRVGLREEWAEKKALEREARRFAAAEAAEARLEEAELAEIGGHTGRRLPSLYRTVEGDAMRAQKRRDRSALKGMRKAARV